MYRSILVPLDGSEFGEHALPLALGIARRAGAGLHLAHVHWRPAPLFTEPRANVENTLDPGARRRARAYLDEVVKQLAAVSAVPVTAAVLEGGIVESLVGHAAATGADLVVMATHGRGLLSRFWLGSAADGRLRQSPAPPLLGRPQEGPPGLAPRPGARHLPLPPGGPPTAAAGAR